MHDFRIRSELLANLATHHDSQAQIYREEADRMLDAGERFRRRGEKFSLWRGISGMSTGQLSGLERETFEENARVAGLPFDPQRVHISWDQLQDASFAKRDLTVGTTTAGGFLVETAVAPALDVLRNFSASARAGVRFLPNQKASKTIPKVTTAPVGSWLTNEAAQLTPSTPVLAQLASSPKNVGVSVGFSRQLSLEADVDVFLRVILLSTVAALLDAAIYQGTGASGQPTGILNTSGVGTQSGATLGRAGVTSMKRKIAEANALDENISYIGTPAIRELLENRQVFTGATATVWDNDRVAARPAYVSNSMPTATMVAGDYSQIVVPLWGPGVGLEINPQDPTGFKFGQIQARVILSCDVVVLQPAAFVAATSIT